MTKEEKIFHSFLANTIAPSLTTEQEMLLRIEKSPLNEYRNAKINSRNQSNSGNSGRDSAAGGNGTGEKV